MSVSIFFFVLSVFVTLELILLTAPMIEVFELFLSFRSPYLRVVDKRAVIKGNQG